MVEPPPKIHEEGTSCPKCGAPVPAGGRCPRCGASDNIRTTTAVLLFVLLGLPAAVSGACFGLIGALSLPSSDAIFYLLIAVVLIALFVYLGARLINSRKR